MSTPTALVYCQSALSSTRRRIVCLLALAGAGGAMWAVQKHRNGAPVPRLMHDGGNVGIVRPLSKVDCRFEFENTGSSGLSITDIKASCGCTKPKVEHRRVGSRERLSIVVSFSATAAVGDFSHLLWVRFNEAKPRTWNLRVAGRVEWPISVEPSSIEWRSVRPGEEKTAMISVSTSVHSPPFIESTRASCPSLMIEKIGATPRVEKYRVKFVARPGLDRMDEYVEFRTNCRERELVRIPVVVEALRGVTVAPRAILLPDSRPGQSHRARLLVEDFERVGKPTLELLGDGWAATYDLPISTWGAANTVSLEIVPPSGEGYHRATLRAVFPSGIVEEVPVTCMVRQK